MRRRPVIPALCAVMLLVLGQLVGLAHRAEERHVTCAEHGEELEAVELAETLHACEHDHFIALDGEADGGHDECAAARALRQQSVGVSTWIAPEPAAVLTELVTVAPLPGATASTLYLIAPKTSPPRPS